MSQPPYWATTKVSNDTTQKLERIHVYPVADLKPHILESFCACHPKTYITDEGGIVVVHNAHDGRELVEQHGLQ